MIRVLIVCALSVATVSAASAFLPRGPLEAQVCLRYVPGSDRLRDESARALSEFREFVFNNLSVPSPMGFRLDVSSNYEAWGLAKANSEDALRLALSQKHDYFQRLVFGDRSDLPMVEVSASLPTRSRRECDILVRALFNAENEQNEMKLCGSEGCGHVECRADGCVTVQWPRW